MEEQKAKLCRLEEILCMDLMPWQCMQMFWPTLGDLSLVKAILFILFFRGPLALMNLSLDKTTNKPCSSSVRKTGLAILIVYDRETRVLCRLALVIECLCH